MFNHCPHCGGFSLLFYTVIQRRMFHMGYHHPFDSETFAFSLAEQALRRRSGVRYSVS